MSLLNGYYYYYYYKYSDVRWCFHMFSFSKDSLNLTLRYCP